MTIREQIHFIYDVAARIAERHAANLTSADDEKGAAAARFIAKEIRWAQGSRKPKPGHIPPKKRKR